MGIVYFVKLKPRVAKCIINDFHDIYTYES